MSLKLNQYKFGALGWVRLGLVRLNTKCIISWTSVTEFSESLESSDFHSGVWTRLGYKIYSMSVTHQNGICLVVCEWVLVSCSKFKNGGWCVCADTSSQIVSCLSWILFWSLELGVVLNILLGGSGKCPKVFSFKTWNGLASVQYGSVPYSLVLSKKFIQFEAQWPGASIQFVQFTSFSSDHKLFWPWLWLTCSAWFGSGSSGSSTWSIESPIVQRSRWAVLGIL